MTSKKTSRKKTSPKHFCTHGHSQRTTLCEAKWICGTTSPRVTVLALSYESVKRERRLRKSKKKHNNTNWTKETKPQTTNLSETGVICAQKRRSLFLCLIFVYLGPVKGISYTKSIKRVCLSNQQSDVGFVRPAEKY